MFGWPALVEKIIARQAGIDDRTLELAKVMVLRYGERDAGARAGASCAWSRRGADDVVLAWVRPADGAVETAMRVPRSLIAEIDAEPEPWKAMREDGRRGPGRRLPARDARGLTLPSVITRVIDSGQPPEDAGRR